VTDSVAVDARPVSAGGPPVLGVRDVTVRVGSRTLLDGVTFEVTSGEVVAIIGPNGAGKTTLLEVIAGMRGADLGTVAFHGVPVRTFAARARHIAFLPDGGELPSELRVRDVIEHALRFRPRPPALVAELRHALDTDSLLDAPAGVLSRGERQRVASFTALAVDRPVVILDEPFDAFDPLKLRDVLAAVKRVANSGAAVLATVHHLGDAAKIADRLLILSEGRGMAWGTLESLRTAAGAPGGTLEDVFVALLSRGTHAP
jgi:iron complex transport system ATP-binding protein